MTSEKIKEWAFIINPIAGNNYAKSLVPKIKTEINKHKINASLLFTERKGHATELAESAIKDGAKYIVSVGGDGTLNEIARTMIGNNDVVLGVIPAGTGNDFIQILGFPNRLEDHHWDIFFEKNITKLDAGSSNGVPFFNGMGLGFDAEVAAQNYTGEGELVKKGGKDKYIWHIVKTLLFFKEQKMIAISDNERHEEQCFMNTISIGRRYAAGFFITPKAIANDGLFDICMVRKINLFNRFRILLMVPKGTHTEDKYVNYYRSEKVNLEFSKAVHFHVDGELYKASNFEVKIIKDAINAIYNPQGNHYLSI